MNGDTKTKAEIAEAIRKKHAMIITRTPEMIRLINEIEAKETSKKPRFTLHFKLMDKDIREAIREFSLEFCCMWTVILFTVYIVLELL